MFGYANGVWTHSDSFAPDLRILFRRRAYPGSRSSWYVVRGYYSLQLETRIPVRDGEDAPSPGSLLVPLTCVLDEQKKEQQLENNRGIIYPAKVTPYIHVR